MKIKQFFYNTFENLYNNFFNELIKLKKTKKVKESLISSDQLSMIPLTNEEYKEELKEVDKFFLSALKLSISDAKDMLDAGYQATPKIKKIIANDLLVKFATQFLGINYSHMNTLNTSVSQEFAHKNIDDTINKIKFFGENNLLLPETLSYFFDNDYANKFLNKKYAYKDLDSYSSLKFFISTSDILLQNKNNENENELEKKLPLHEWNNNELNNKFAPEIQEIEIKYSEKKIKHHENLFKKDLEIILTKPVSEPKPFQFYYTNLGDSTYYRKDLFEKPFLDEDISNIFIDTLIKELIKSKKTSPNEIFNKSWDNNTSIATNVLSTYKKDIINDITSEQIEHIILYFKPRIFNYPFFNCLSNIQKEVHNIFKNKMMKKIHNENYEQAIIDFDFIKISSSLNLPQITKSQLNNIQTKINDLENSGLNAENKNFIKNLKNEIINTLINYGSVQELDNNFNKDEISNFISQYEFSITNLQQEIVSNQLTLLKQNNKVKFK